MVRKLLGHYEIHESLGSGGMGDVYRARDTKLERDVAIKMLPENFATDADCLARLEREAKLLAALNHPHIATIHSLEEAEGARFLVLELIKGESLAQRLATGALPVEEALGVCKQIAEALEAAHDEGIIHRDLKPANVLLTPDGRAKVLDFGIAKSTEVAAEATELPRATNLTVTGAIIGTPAYMSPEQVRGERLDKRSDNWAFGCLLYETLTGKSAFGRSTLADTLVAILEQEPNWTALPKAVPDVARLLLGRCLKKDANHRLQTIGDARIEIDEAMSGPAAETTGTVGLRARAPGWSRALPWGAALLLAIVATGAVYWAASRPVQQLTGRFQIAPPPGERLVLPDDPNMAVSPDGTHIAYLSARDGVTRLYVRATAQPDTRVIPDTDAAHSPFFSPDGQWVGFFDDSDRTLKKAPTAGGPAQLVCDAPGAHAGASWGPDDTIVFSSVGSGLGVVSSSGGTPEQLTATDDAAGELRHEFPEALPNGKGVLFTVEREGGRGVAVLDLETRRYEMVVPGGTGARYAPTGHIVYGQDESLMAVLFDQERLEATGPAVQLPERVKATSDGSLEFSFSRGGMLVYAPPPQSVSTTTLVWVDQERHASPVFEREGSFDSPRLSPDGERVVLHRADSLWVFDIRRDVLAVLTSDGGPGAPTWSPDGRWIYHHARFEDDRDLYRTSADLSGPAERVLAAERDQGSPSVSPDGNSLLYDEVDPVTGYDIWALSLEGDANAEPIIRTPAAETGPRISPDGQWFSYLSDVSGQWEVYVRPFRGQGRTYQVSSGGGVSPRWSRDGKTVFYQTGPRIMAVEMAIAAGDGPGAPRQIFEDETLFLQGVALDGRFLMAKRTRQPAAHLNVVLSWFEELQRLVPPVR